MADIVLRDLEQRALRALLLSEPVPGNPLPSLRVLETIARIIPCDSIGVDLADQTGRVLAGVTPAGPRHAERDPQVCDGPLWLGLVHVSRMPIKAPLLATRGLADSCFSGSATEVTASSSSSSSGRTGPCPRVMSRLISGHASLTGSGAEVIRRMLGDDTPLTLHSSVTQTDRSYPALSSIEADALNSRIGAGCTSGPPWTTATGSPIGPR